MAKSLYFGKEPPAAAPQQQQQPQQAAHSGRPASRPSGSDTTDPIAIRVAINIGKSELELQRTANQVWRLPGRLTISMADCSCLVSCYPAGLHAHTLRNHRPSGRSFPEPG